MTKQTKPVIHFRIYRGAEVLLTKKSGEVKNENHIVKLTYDTQEFTNYFKQLKASNIGQVDLEKIFIDGKEIEKADFPEDIVKFFANLYATPEAALTPDQQKIANLEQQLESLKQYLPNTAAEAKAHPEATATSAAHAIEEAKNQLRNDPAFLAEIAASLTPAAPVEETKVLEMTPAASTTTDAAASATTSQTGSDAQTAAHKDLNLLDEDALREEFKTVSGHAPDKRWGKEKLIIEIGKEVAKKTK